MTFPEIGAGPGSAVANIQKAKKIIFLSVVAEVEWKISLLKSCLGYPGPEGEGLFSNLTLVLITGRPRKLILLGEGREAPGQSETWS